MLYCQARFDVIEGNFMCTDVEALLLAALVMQIEHGMHLGIWGRKRERESVCRSNTALQGFHWTRLDSQEWPFALPASALTRDWDVFGPGDHDPAKHTSGYLAGYIDQYIPFHVQQLQEMDMWEADLIKTPAPGLASVCGTHNGLHLRDARGAIGSPLAPWQGCTIIVHIRATQPLAANQPRHARMEGFDETSSKQNYVRCSQQFSTYGYNLFPVHVSTSVCVVEPRACIERARIVLLLLLLLPLPRRRLPPAACVSAFLRFCVSAAVACLHGCPRGLA